MAATTVGCCSTASSTDEIDAALEELCPASPAASRVPRRPRRASPSGGSVGRRHHDGRAGRGHRSGPGFSSRAAPLAGRSSPSPGARLNRLCVHPAIVDFMDRALQSTDLRCTRPRSSAKYTGDTNYEQPMHTDRNHSWLPPRMEPPWWHVESFLYLSDVDEGTAPTHLVPLPRLGRPLDQLPLICPTAIPSSTRPNGRPRACAARCSCTAPTCSTAGSISPPGRRALPAQRQLQVAGQDWIGYHSDAVARDSLDWDRFVEASTPRELELFGFPPPGHPIWNAELLDLTAERYPKLDLTPWRAAH